DTAAAASATAVGPARRRIEQWVQANAPSRAEALRYVAIDLKGELRDTVRAAAEALDALARDAKAGAPVEEHQRARAESLHHAIAWCPAASFASPMRPRVTQEAVIEALSAHSQRARACYNEALATKPALEGKVVVSFVIAPSGALDDAADAGSALP